jgi:glycerol kinase
MEAVADKPLAELRADGGATANGWLMQFQADLLGVPVAVAELAETTALGAALLAGVGVGAWTQDDVARRDATGARYEPQMGDDERGELMQQWQRAVQRAGGWARG